MIPNDVEFSQLCNVCQDITHTIKPEYFVITTTDNKVIIRTLNTHHVIMFQLRLPKLTRWKLDNPIRLEVEDIIDGVYKPTIFKNHKKWHTLTLYDKYFYDNDLYYKKDPGEVILEFNKKTNTAGKNVLLSLNNKESIFRPRYLANLFYTMPEELHVKLCFHDAPFIVKYRVRNILVYGIVAPMLYDSHDMDNLLWVKL